MKLMIAMAVCLFAAPAMAGPQRMLGSGGRSLCESVTYAIATGPAEPGATLVVNAALSWMFGYLSASHDSHMETAELGGDLLRDVTEDEVIEWLRSDCSRRPNQTVQQAARRFVVAIMVTRSKQR